LKEGNNMTKIIVIFMALTLLVSAYLFPAPQDFSGLDIKIGNVRIPKAFIHAGKDYNKGIYWVTLKEKDGFPYFNIHNRKKELLFEEMAVLKNRNYKGKAKKFKHWIKNELLRGYEFYRIKVSRADSFIMAYLLLNQKKNPAAQNKPKNKDSGVNIQ
jgi:hypothetical protein